MMKSEDEEDAVKHQDDKHWLGVLKARRKSLYVSI